ncbi:asparagine synthase-related protein [Nesterenkonia sp. CL21]|uniref:asparagine synthase-related protein n=1 Tax=Nesterenkonia sp. CL21 TaxID=3064894 RepID=UPI00287B1712|nr:asparagine synthase-related protein [Nesterenkonia sp. CL21]MDS2174056.1 asparagine synthase-related protein [Nesterenkonia sp. CL21]
MPALDASAQTVHATPSAVAPVFVRTGRVSAASDDAAPPFAADRLDLLLDGESPLTPDWTAWAEILAFGAPLAGRTPFQEIRRLQPGESAGRHGDEVTIRRGTWDWAEIDPEPGLDPRALTDDVLEVLRARLGRDADVGPLLPMLSGGRDSRLLTALAHQVRPEELVAWTTSSDTGTSMEELAAARTAQVLGVEQRIVPAAVEDFPRDARDYGRAVHHMASFHIWLMPVSRAIAEHSAASGGVVLDGLGGGVFLGGGFPDDPALEGEGGSAPDVDAVVASRFARLGRYLDAAEDILPPGLGEELAERARADFEDVALPFAQHPNGATLTAYLTRTLPGISLAPVKVLGSAAPTRTPIMADEVVRQALRVPAEQKQDGLWYPHLLERADARLASLPTAADRTRRRQHVRRIESLESAGWLRGLILGSPAGDLLSDRMREAPVEAWAEELSRTKPQHLVRGLALLALWLHEHRDRLAQAEPDVLLPPRAAGEARHG